jgi:hypothetical protein
MKPQIIALLLFSCFFASAKSNVKTELFKDITLQTDSGNYSKILNTIEVNNEKKICFKYYREDEVCHVILNPDSLWHFKAISLQESGDYDIIDSIRNYNNLYYDFKIRFKHLTKSDFLKFTIIYSFDSVKYNYDVNLFPVFKTTARLNINTNDITVGEEKVFELITNNVDNIKYSPDWDNSQDISYRIVENNGRLHTHIIANSTGTKTLNIHLDVYKPDYIDKKLVYDLPELTYSFNIRSAGLVFLQTDKTEIMYDENTIKNGITIQIDNNRYLQLNKTYLIDAKETPGSPLIATLYLHDKLTNNKATGTLHIFNLHKQSDGYLYIKDGDDPKFITNLNIIPNTSIDEIKIMRNGKDWIEDNNVYPGEMINLRLEGQSLSKAKFTFDALVEIASDSAIKNDNFIEYKLKVPLTISKKTITIYNYNQNTGKSLNVKEYQKARPFDYINVSLGHTVKNVSKFQGPEIYGESLKDVIISFNPNKIDEDNKLYGKQYVDIDVKIFDKDGNLKDFTTISNTVVCPGDKSPRYSFYDKSDCSTTEINLNSKLNGKIYDLNDWSKIRISFKNTDGKYTKDNQSKTIEIVLQKMYSFDIDVSFPAGLLIKKADDTVFGNFTGISMAVIAQYSFYAKDKIAKLEPYKIGVGFIAIDAFDFNKTSTNRDMGIVAIGTLNPVSANRKLSFPIYFGGGYLLSAKKMFWLIGPGISVQF